MILWAAVMFCAFVSLMSLIGLIFSKPPKEKESDKYRLYWFNPKTGEYGPHEDPPPLFPPRGPNDIVVMRDYPPEKKRDEEN